ncbi:MAG: hypothetical protein R2875_16310 [Desulfobacterales bacterium]
MLGWFLLIAFLSERKGMGNILNKNLISEKLFLNLSQSFTDREDRGVLTGDADACHLMNATG